MFFRLHNLKISENSSAQTAIETNVIGCRIHHNVIKPHADLSKLLQIVDEKHYSAHFHLQCRVFTNVFDDVQ